MKKTLVQKLGLLGIVSFLSYTAAVVFAPLAYPGYNWMAQAVSDLSAANAPSLALWNQLSALYNACEVVCATVVCIGIQGRKTRLLRTGIYVNLLPEADALRLKQGLYVTGETALRALLEDLGE